MLCIVHSFGDANVPNRSARRRRQSSSIWTNVGFIHSHECVVFACRINLSTKAREKKRKIVSSPNSVVVTCPRQPNNIFSCGKDILRDMELNGQIDRAHNSSHTTNACRINWYRAIIYLPKPTSNDINLNERKKNPLKLFLLFFDFLFFLNFFFNNERNENVFQSFPCSFDSVKHFQFVVVNVDVGQWRWQRQQQRKNVSCALGNYVSKSERGYGEHIRCRIVMSATTPQKYTWCPSDSQIFGLCEELCSPEIEKSTRRTPNISTWPTRACTLFVRCKLVALHDGALGAGLSRKLDDRNMTNDNDRRAVMLNQNAACSRIV